MAVYLIASEPVYPFFVAGREGRRIDIKSTEKEREAWDRDRQTDRHIGRQTGRAITLHLVLVEEQDERSTPIEIWTHTHTHTHTHSHTYTARDGGGLRRRSMRPRSLRRRTLLRRLNSPAQSAAAQSAARSFLAFFVSSLLRYLMGCHNVCIVVAECQSS